MLRVFELNVKNPALILPNRKIAQMRRVFFEELIMCDMFRIENLGCTSKLDGPCLWHIQMQYTSLSFQANT